MILCVCVTAAMTGCEEQAEEDNKPDPAPPFSALGEVKEGRKNIYVIVKNLNSNYWQVVVDAAKDSSLEYDCNIFCSGCNAEIDWESQSRLLDEAVASGADAVVLSPNDSVKLASKIDEVYEKGIKVVLIDTAANTDNYDVCFMTDNLLAGQLASEAMIDQLRGMGYKENEELSVGIEVGTTFSQTISERLAGFLQYWSRNAPDNWTVVSDLKLNEGDSQIAYQTAIELIDDNPEMRGVFGCNNDSTEGMVKAVKERQRTDIAVVGFDYSTDIIDMVKSDEYNASSVLQRQYEMSQEGIKAALELSEGKKYDRKFVDMGIVIVKKSNLDKPEIRDILSHN